MKEVKEGCFYNNKFCDYEQCQWCYSIGQSYEINCWAINIIIMNKYIIWWDDQVGIWFIRLRSFRNLELNNCPSNLDALPLVLLLYRKLHVLLSHQGSELRIIVQNEKLVVLDFYLCVLTLNIYVRYSDLTLVASPEFDASLRSILDHHYALLLLTGALEDQVCSLRPIQSDQLLIVDPSTLCFHLNKARELTFADFAFEFSKVIVLGASNHFFFDFDSNPLCEAVVVNSSAGAIALARIEEEVIVLLNLIKTNFAGIFILRR